MCKRTLQLTFLLSFVILLLLVTGCVKQQNIILTNTTKSSSLEDLGSGLHKLSLTMVDNNNTYRSGVRITRHYIINIPPNFNPRQTYDILLFFHGNTGSAQAAVDFTNFVALSNTENFIVVFPQAMGIARDGFDNRFSGDVALGNNNACWDSRSGNEPSNICYGGRRQPDDDGFIDSLIANAHNNFVVGRIFTSGFSNGCKMAQHIALTRNDINAMAVSGCKVATDAVTYQESVSMGTKRPIPLVLFHGTSDDVSEYMYLDEPLPLDTLPSAERAIDEYATIHGCSKPPTITADVASIVSLSQVDHWVYEHCAVSTEFYKLEGGTHKWYLPMSPIVWNFLDANG